MATKLGYFITIVLFAYASSLEASTVPFSDGFEEYPPGTTFLIETNGWGANKDTLAVQEVTSHSGARAVVCPSGTTLSNSVNGAGIGKLWTDQYVRPNLGAAPEDTPDSSESVRLYFDFNGYMAIATAGGWDMCATDVHGGTVNKATGGWVRVSIHHNFADGQIAVLLNGKVVRQEIAFIGAAAATYSQILYRNPSDALSYTTNAFVDDVLITTNLPPGLDAGADGDGDGMADAEEIHRFGSTVNSALIAQSLPFDEDFESYAPGSRVDEMANFGWTASSADVIVQDGRAHGDTNAVIIPRGTAVSNSIDTTAMQTWSDWYCVPIGGGLPPDAPDDKESLRLFFTTNGYVAIATAGGWDVCKRDVFNEPVVGITNAWTRLTLHHNYATRKAAVLLNGRVLRDRIPFIGANATNYTGIIYRNTSGWLYKKQPHAYLDDFIVTTEMPSDLTEDGDGDGRADAEEIDAFGNVSRWPRHFYLIVQ